MSKTSIKPETRRGLVAVRAKKNPFPLFRRVCPFFHTWTFFGSGRQSWWYHDKWRSGSAGYRDKINTLVKISISEPVFHSAAPSTSTCKFMHTVALHHVLPSDVHKSQFIFLGVLFFYCFTTPSGTRAG